MTVAGRPIGIYVHVPFCRTRCRYCDFYRVGDNAARMALFLGALGREIEGLTELHGREIDTIFFGGGTPSLLAPEEIEAVLAHLRRRFRLTATAEVSLEANPSDLDQERLEAYRSAGANRLSLGVQSFVDRELALLGRRHDGAHAARCVGWARRAGFDNVSVDLMLGIPGQTRGSLHVTLDRAVALASDHLSAYLLEVHPDSEIDGLRRSRPRLFPSAESQRRAYLVLAETLSRAGLEQYEISNFSRPGRECRHNLKYWRRDEFLGLGPSAHSSLDGRRWRRPPDLAGYLVDPLRAEELDSDPAAERLFLGLRLVEGLAVHDLAELLDLPVSQLPGRLAVLSPFLDLGPERVRLTREGFLVSNAVLAELLAWRERPRPAGPA